MNLVEPTGPNGQFGDMGQLGLSRWRNARPLRLSNSERSLTNPDTGCGRFAAKSTVYYHTDWNGACSYVNLVSVRRGLHGTSYE
jgi:hypothetical protein